MDRIARVAFFVSAAFLLLLLGFAAARYRFGALSFLEQPLDAAAALMISAVDDQDTHPVRHDYTGARTSPAGQPVAGVTLLTSNWPEFGDTAGVRVIDHEGRVLHRWLIGSVYAHGTWLSPDGELVFNLEQAGLFCLDPTGTPRWHLDRNTHHSVARDDDGNFWVCETVNLIEPAEVEDRYPGLAAPAVEEHVLCVAPDGSVVHDLNVLEALYRSPYSAILFQPAGLSGGVYHQSKPSGDILHLNDVEPLPRALADQHPMFAAGDLLISARNLNLVFVLGRESGRIKWANAAGWIRQHDPDWLADGWISVYDNHLSSSADGRDTGGSRITAVQPATGRIRTVYPPPTGEGFFYSAACGKVQALDGTVDGRWLITESFAGRVLEIDGTGREVWSWVRAPQPDGQTVYEVQEGTRYPYTREQVLAWPKPDGFVPETGG